MIRILRAALVAACVFAPAAFALQPHAHDSDEALQSTFFRYERNERRPEPIVLAARIKARQNFFGKENVDARTGKIDDSKVIISWFSVASFAMAARGRVFLLDSYIYRLADTPAYVPTTVQELVDLKPEAIFIGHGHGDHADNAAYISRIAGAKIYGAAEHCDAMRGDAIRLFGAGATVDCTAITSPGSAPGAEVVSLSALSPDLCITAFKHVHSALVPVDPTLPQNLVNAVRDPRVDALYPANPPPAMNTRTVAGAGGVISIFYQFTVAGSDFTVAWHDTAGPLKEQAPQILPILAGLPKTDVQLGAMVSIGEANNGVRDIATYINQLRPKQFFGHHSDNFNIGASPYYIKAINRQFDIFNVPVSARPEILGLHDPYDYLRPGLMTYDYKADAWKDGRGNRRDGFCRR